MEHRRDPEFPDVKVIENRFGPKRDLLERLFTLIDDDPDFADVREMVSDTLIAMPKSAKSVDVAGILGYVYLVKMDKWFKIGKTNDILRRTGELRITLPERETLVHTISTVDSSGVEGYWHKRFDDRRRNGEWFLLSPGDVREFKNWRRIS